MYYNLINITHSIESENWILIVVLKIFYIFTKFASKFIL